MAPTLRMHRGFHCNVSLRTCTIISASFSMLISLGSIGLSSFFFIGDLEQGPAKTAEEIHWDYDEREEYDHMDSMEWWTVTEPTESSIEEDYFRDFRTFFKVSMILDACNLVFCYVDLVLSSVLIYGAAKRKSAYIRPWFFVGNAMVVYDIAYVIAHLAMNFPLIWTFAEILHLPFICYLIVVAWNLYLDCREIELRNASSPVSMSTLLEDGSCQAEEACSVSYSGLGKE